MFARLANEYSNKGLNIIGVCFDIVDEYGNIDEEQMEIAKNILSKSNAKYSQYVPTKEFMDSYINKEVQYVPDTIILDKNGKIFDIVIGGKSEEEWKNLFDKVLQ